MCGIAGKLSLDLRQPVDPRLIDRMTSVIAHRGPDGQGAYVAGPVGLGHRRLSIIDLNTGSQPMCNEDATVWITYNGEIYNYTALREDLLQRGHTFRSQSDTEVIVHLWEEHGVQCLERLRGMFAFALWDATRKALFIARDRIGIKPLYYCETPQSLIFSSEIKALLADPEVPRDVSPEAVDRFLTYLYLPGGQTIFRHVRKLEPGQYLLAAGGTVVRKQYWDLKYEDGRRWTTFADAADALRSLLQETVRSHMISDVPVGFLASGGVDSTALLSFAVEQTTSQVQTFTVGFSDPDVVDERPFARHASRHFNTRHHEITVSAKEFGDFLPKYVWHMEEPVCEPPAVALYYVAKLARQHVKVLLSGEGGDEAFGGYPEYRHYPAFERWKTMIGPFRGAAKAALALAGRLEKRRRIARYATLMDLELPDYYYSRVTSPDDYFNRQKHAFYSDEFAHTVGGHAPSDVTRTLFHRMQGGHVLNRMLYVDAKTWLPDDLLVKADKMTMAASLELRVPFLDHKVLEFAATLPPEFKVKGSETKRVLKEAFRNRVPPPILARRKAGFPVPYGRWLTHELKDLVAGTLLSTRSLTRGYFKKEAVVSLLDHNAAPALPTREIFSLLILELWHRQFSDHNPDLVSVTS